MTAARSGVDIPARYFTILGSRIDGAAAIVWVLTNDREPFEEYECNCFRENGQWHEVG